jgi:ribosome biogenesis GTPase
MKMTGTVLGGTNNFFDVECIGNETGIPDSSTIQSLNAVSSSDTLSSCTVIRQCSIKGKILKSDKEYYNPLAPGDIVEIETDSLDAKKGQIISLSKRKNEFVRWNVKGRCPQLLAANIDYLILVTTPDEPPFRPRFIDRELAQAEYQNLTPVIICNKCDLATANDVDFIHRLAIWEQLGYKIIKTSTKTGEGMDELSSLLAGKLSALVGQSGVGKSSLINKLDSSAELRIGDLCEKYGRGSHTTTKGTLMHLILKSPANSASSSHSADSSTVTASVIDTPGVRRFVLHDIAAEDLALYFPEMQPFVGKCTFGMSCTHLSEPGCKIIEAVYSGVISEERYDSWKRIATEIKTESWED